MSREKRSWPAMMSTVVLPERTEDDLRRSGAMRRDRRGEDVRGGSPDERPFGGRTAGGKCGWPAEMYRIFARDPSLEPLTTAIFERQLHEEDRGRVMAAIQRAIHEHVPYDLEYRFVIGTGEVRHFHGRAQCYVDASGTATRLSGTITDITGRKEMHEALELGTERVAWQGGCGALVSGVGRGIPGAGSEVLNSDTPGSSIDVAPLPDGRVCSLLSHKFAIQLPNGERLVAGTRIDISQQKEAEKRTLQALAEKELLPKEVHHRVKNNLQVICSLLNMQAGTLREGAALATLRDSHDWVQSMALIHELLYGSSSMKDFDFSE